MFHYIFDVKAARVKAGQEKTGQLFGVGVPIWITHTVLVGENSKHAEILSYSFPAVHWIVLAHRLRRTTKYNIFFKRLFKAAHILYSSTYRRL